MADVPEAKRRYKLRPTLSTGRATFICYTCGIETPSTNLVLVYCCQNAENEPFFPFIKSMKPYPNASPISPQGKLSLTIPQTKSTPFNQSEFGLKTNSIVNLLQIETFSCNFPILLQEWCKFVLSVILNTEIPQKQ